ncbi:Chloride channel protein D [Picochlorum sp. SENEW3]|nr:Chloride channel protein D [Picochlorum sp. SENEW3]
MEKRTEERFPLSSDPDQAVLGNGRTTPPGEHQQDPGVGVMALLNRGHDLESASQNHTYTAKEKKKLLAAESIDYLAPSSRVYKHWLAQQAWGRHWDRWLVMACIGIAMGVVGFSLHYLIHFFSFIKYHGNRWLLGHTHVLIGWMFNVSFSLALVYGSTWLVVHVAPEAAGAGVSEVMAYLNGCDIPNILTLKTLVVKFLSAALAVGSGLPVGPEGPMVHIGAIMAAGLSQGHSTHLGWDSGLLRRFQNPKDKRDFVTAGAAVGVATAFSAPVGGLLFMFEEVASFWQQSLGWQIFFACMVSVLTADTLHSGVSALKEGTFGLFDDEASTVFFEVQTQLATHAMAIIPAAVCGLVSGLLAIAFTFLNLRVTRMRSELLKTKKAKMMEPCILIVVFITIGTILPLFFPCVPTQCVIIQGESTPVCPEGTPPRIQRIVEDSIELYTCSPDAATSDIPPDWDTDPSQSNITVPKSYNELATLMSVTGEESIRHLLSRGTHREFGYAAILCMLAFYFIGAAVAAGSAISSGTFVPMLLIGACIGRLVGLVTVNIAASHGAGSDGAPPGVFLPPSPWAWIDPGAFALIGAGAFMGGVTRMTLALAVIMMEMSNDVRILLPAMVAIMLAKWVADAGCHSLYHGLLEVKCVPFLPKEATTSSSLELLEVRHVMAKPVVTLYERMKLGDIRDVLRSTNHNGFPIVSRFDENLIGLVAREHLLKLLVEAVRRGTCEHLEVGYSDLDQGLVDPMTSAAEEEQQLAVLEGHMASTQGMSSANFWEEELDLFPYINMSTYRVSESFSVEKAYLLFTTMGLRHLVVVDEANHVRGIITRKNLLGYRIDEAIESARRSGLNINSQY